MKHPQITQISANRNRHKKAQKAQNRTANVTKEMNAAANLK